MPCGKYLKSYGQFTPVPDSACRFPIHSPLTATLHTSLVNLVPVHARRETLATCAPSGRLSIHNRHQGARGVIHTGGVTITSFSILSVRPNSPHQLLRPGTYETGDQSRSGCGSRHKGIVRGAPPVGVVGEMCMYKETKAGTS